VELLRGILGQLDRIPEQVMIETIIVEATLDSSTKFGVEWQFANSKPFGEKNVGTDTTGTRFNLQNANPALQGFRYTLTGGDLTAFVNALKSDQKFKVLSTPRIFTSNNAEAQINISQRVPYVLSSREDVNGNLTFTYAFEDVGIVLTVTPRITSNGYVTMEINQTANDLQGFTDFNAPIINQRQADTTVSVKDGETIVLGGIIRSTVNSTVRKVPLLGDIPILGNLFKTTDKANVQTELMVFLTPRVVRDHEEARKIQKEQVGDLSKDSQKDVKGLIPPPKPDEDGSKPNGTLPSAPKPVKPPPPGG
jgi:general secretion pathway protein D